MTDFKIVRGAMSGAPLLCMPYGFVYLRNAECGNIQHSAGQFVLGAVGNNYPYKDELTDEEWALAVRIQLVGVDNNG